jgi:hypothetical protein
LNSRNKLYIKAKYCLEGDKERKFKIFEKDDCLTRVSDHKKI